jgi:hypothetical protein
MRGYPSFGSFARLQIEARAEIGPMAGIRNTSRQLAVSLCHVRLGRAAVLSRAESNVHITAMSANLESAGRRLRGRANRIFEKAAP